MSEIVIDTNLIHDWASFHKVWKEAFCFPSFYGENMDAWIDCMSCLTIDDGFVEKTFSKNDTLQIILKDSKNFKERLPEIFSELTVCTKYVNEEYVSHNENFRIMLVLA